MSDQDSAIEFCSTAYDALTEIGCHDIRGGRSVLPYTGDAVSLSIPLVYLVLLEIWEVFFHRKSTVELENAFEAQHLV